MLFNVKCICRTIMRLRVHYYILVLISLSALSSCQEKRQDRFEREAREYTATYCPQRLDGITVLDSMVFKPKGDAGDLRLYYSLTLTAEQRDELMNHLGEMGDQNLKVVRNSVLFTKFKEAGASFTYIYHDVATGDKIAEYHFAKKDYE